MKIFLSKPGVTCCAGDCLEELWRSVLEKNQGGIKKTVASSGKNFFVGKISDDKLLEPAKKYDMRILRLERQALLQLKAAVERAKEKYGADRVAVCVGSCDNGTEFSVAGHKDFFAGGGFPKDYVLEMQGADYVATFAQDMYGLENLAVAFSTACSSSAGAIIKAAELIQSGIADAAIAGGVDIASDTVLLGFDCLEAVSGEVTNPFSKNRKGITLGEGAAFFLLAKDADVAQANFCDERKPPIFLAGSGESSDAHHLTAPEPEGEGAVLAMKKALENAGIAASEIGYVNLHGTGTRHNDSMEAKAMAKIFGENGVPCSSTKPLTGHTLGAASAIEAAVCWAVLANAAHADSTKLPVHIFDGEADDCLPKLLLAGHGNICDRQIKYCMSNSFAFGGANASLIFGRD